MFLLFLLLFSHLIQPPENLDGRCVIVGIVLCDEAHQLWFTFDVVTQVALELEELLWHASTRVLFLLFL